jgi:hypothetical protein
VRDDRNAVIWHHNELKAIRECEVTNVRSGGFGTNERCAYSQRRGGKREDSTTEQSYVPLGCVTWFPATGPVFFRITAVLQVLHRVLPGDFRPAVHTSDFFGVVFVSRANYFVISVIPSRAGS